MDEGWLGRLGGHDLLCYATLQDKILSANRYNQNNWDQTSSSAHDVVVPPPSRRTGVNGQPGVSAMNILKTSTFANAFQNATMSHITFRIMW